jgi:hypothetical protein
MATGAENEVGASHKFPNGTLGVALRAHMRIGDAMHIVARARHMAHASCESRRCVRHTDDANAWRGQCQQLWQDCLKLADQTMRRHE